MGALADRIPRFHPIEPRDRERHAPYARRRPVDCPGNDGVAASKTAPARIGSQQLGQIPASPNPKTQFINQTPNKRSMVDGMEQGRKPLPEQRKRHTWSNHLIMSPGRRLATAAGMLR